MCLGKDPLYILLHNLNFLKVQCNSLTEHSLAKWILIDSRIATNIFASKCDATNASLFFTQEFRTPEIMLKTFCPPLSGISHQESLKAWMFDLTMLIKNVTWWSNINTNTCFCVYMQNNFIPDLFGEFCTTISRTKTLLDERYQKFWSRLQHNFMRINKDYFQSSYAAS